MSGDTALVASLVGYTSPDLPDATVPDISGTVGNLATFDGSGTIPGLPSTILAWAWTTIPAGSTVAIATTLPFPYPDNQAATPIDMTDNEALYHFEGNGNDSSGNGNTLTQFGTPTFPAGKVGANAIGFNGVTQYATASIPAVGTTGTIAGWIYLTQAPINGDVLIGFGVNTSSTNGSWRAIAYENGLTFYGRGGGAYNITGWVDSTTFRVGVWHHVVITWDGANLVSCYYNGQLITAQTKTLVSPVSTDFSLARRANAGSYYAPCNLDEVAVWSRVLSASEIEDIYELQAPLYTSTPLPDNAVSNTFDLSMASNEGLYHFEGNANDSSGNARNGTVSGAVQTIGKVGSNAYAFAHADSTDVITFGSTGFDFVSADAFSFSMWVKPDASQPGTNAVLFGKTNFSTTGYVMFQNGGANSNSYSFVVGTGGGLTGTGVNFSLRAGQWSHVCLTRSANGAQTRIYVNNILVTDVSTLTTIASSGGITLGIGNFSAVPQATLAFNGDLDEFCVWSRELTPFEVETVYDYGNGTYAGWGETFSFTPDVAGTYTVEAEATSIWGSDSTTADAVITSAGSGVTRFELGGNLVLRQLGGHLVV